MKAPKGNEFHFVDGKSASSVSDLVSHIKELSPEQFSAHLNEGKNDFYNWMKDCIDAEVAEDIHKAKSQREVIERLTGHHWHREHKKKHNY